MTLYSINVLRRAMRTHVLVNRYEFYYLHNGGQKITIFCRKRCNYEWNPKSINLPQCKCDDKVKKSEYLAERYVEEWRSNPTWKIKTFRASVLSDLGIHIGYSLAWLVRARAKFMIYGSTAEQYARIWYYGKAVLKYNKKSGVYMVVEGAHRPEPPLFIRMYMCLAALKNGFNKGCRALISLDDCHFKRAYPGQILVVVGKDGNNQIFPIALATVEIENKDGAG
ncbi:uncharacterized protein LOC110709288 [Chenopodium quinoa]|uniref:uncharacterized protein LOC110709288 n=1 Tax=Chenopodium quinoa TaxID=63459 RepID=UPI000B785FAB|nr:uncharacterized protein LOC110709288 [Chenopodium quinoa]